MKMVVAVLRHTELQRVQEALLALGIQGMTVSEVKGFGRQGGYTELYRAAEYAVRFLPKVKVEVAVPDGRLQEVLQAIQGSARTGQVGDGKIFVYDLLQVIRIRTAEKGEEAL
jgi:nitrogen regulatory protein P-II 2